MPGPARSSGPIVLRCDGGGRYGVGHVMRQLALADELLSRDLPVQFWGALTDVDWLASMVATRGLSFIPAAETAGELRDQAVAAGASAVVLDGYHLPPDTGSVLRSAGIPVMAMVDYTFGAEQEADLYVDQNLGAVAPPNAPGRWLTGIEYALFRDDILRLRRPAPREQQQPPRVLAVFGGTDPYAAALVVVPALLATGIAMAVTAVAAREEIAAGLRDLPLSPGQSLEVIGSTPALAGLASDSDLVVSASGSSVWEFLCLGVPTALICVVDNQRAGYEETLRRGVVAGLGQLDAFDPAAATATLADLLTSPDRLTTFAARGQLLVDGRGRERVADALVSLT